MVVREYLTILSRLGRVDLLSYLRLGFHNPMKV
jgi:hypothetical protein